MSKKLRTKLQKIVDRDYDYRNYADEDVYLAEAPGKQHGMFAVRQFVPGEVITVIEGQRVRVKDYAGSNYVMSLSDKWMLEPYSPWAISNHSCNPNAELVGIKDKHLVLVAKCNIEEDQEITYDYGWKAAKWIPKCHCNSHNCRGWIVAEDQVEAMKKLKGLA